MGLLDGITSTADDVYQGVAGVGDDAAGNFDESIGRQFDDEAGGGFADWDTWVDNEDPGPVGDFAEGVTYSLVRGSVDSEEAAEQAVDDGVSSLSHEETTNLAADLIAEPAGVTIDGAQDVADEVTPGWFDWIVDNQEIVVAVLVVFAFAYATQGTVGTRGGSA